MSQPAFNEGFIYKFKKILGKPNFLKIFKKTIIRQTARMVVDRNTVDSNAALFKSTAAVRVSDSVAAST